MGSYDTYNTLVGVQHGGDVSYVKNGGTLHVETGGVIKLNATDVDLTFLAAATTATTVAAVATASATTLTTAIALANALKTSLNSVIAKLKTAGIIASS